MVAYILKLTKSNQAGLFAAFGVMGYLCLEKIV